MLYLYYLSVGSHKEYELSINDSSLSGDIRFNYTHNPPHISTMYLLAKICDTLWENLAGDKEILFLQYLLPGLKMIPSAKFEVNCMLYLGAVSSSFTPAQKLQLEEIFNFNARENLKACPH